MAARCSAPGCEKLGTSRCTGCGIVGYCGRECQKLHWKTHKLQCKAAGAANGAAALTSPSGKQQANSGVSNNGGSSGSIEAQWRSALALAQKNGSALECGQILYNLSCVRLRSGAWAEAQEHASDARRQCELALQQDPDSLPAKELLVLSLVGLSLSLIESRQFEAAEQLCAETVEHAERHFGLAHPQLVKTLRVYAMLQDRQQNHAGAVVLLRRALAATACETEATPSQQQQPAVQDRQEITDELVKQLMQAGRPEEALDAAAEHFDAVVAGGLSEAAQADSLVTYATVLGKSGRLPEAEDKARRALELRIRAFGEAAPQTAVAMTVLAGVMEEQGNVGAEPEGLLLQASQIFQRAEGSRGNAMMVLNQLQRMRAHREEDRGGALMRRASGAFEAKSFKQAEALLAEAVDYFTATFGAQHPNTLTAVQNLGIARQNALIQLWREVAAEEVARGAAGEQTAADAWESDLSLAMLGVPAAPQDSSASSCAIC